MAAGARGSDRAAGTMRLGTVLLLAAMVFLQLPSGAAAQNTSTHSFTSGAVGSHPNTLTFSNNNVVVDLSALPAGTTCYRAMLVTQRGGNAGNQNNDPAGPLVQVESADAPGTYLSFVTPSKVNLDCTAAVQRAWGRPPAS